MKTIQPIKGLAAAFAILLVATSFSQGKLETVSWTTLGEGLQISITGSNLKPPKVTRPDGRSMILEFDGGLVGSANKLIVGQRGVDQVKSVWFSKSKVRVQVKFSADNVNGEVKQSKAGWDVLVGNVATKVVVSPMDEAIAMLSAERMAKDESPMTALAPNNSGQRRIQMTFFDTDIALVLKAISVQTKANIVLASQEKAKVSINVSAATADEAIRAATAAAGLSFQKADSTYVVAPLANLRQALVPYGRQKTISVLPGTATVMAERLTGALPLSTVRANGDQIIVVGLPDDLRQLDTLAAGFARDIAADKSVSEVFLLSKAQASEIAKILTSVFPDLKIVATDEGENKASVGAVAITGRAGDVMSAFEMAKRLDVEGSGSMGALAYEVYHLKYTSAPAVVEFLKKAAPEVEAMAGPDSFSPQRGYFSPLASAIRTAGGGEGGGGGAGAGVGGGAQGQQQGGQNQGGGQGNNQGNQQNSAERASVVVLKGPRKSVEASMKLVEQLDTKPIQLTVDVKVLETSGNFGKNLGMNFSWTALRFFEVPAGTIASGIPGIDLTDFTTKPVSAGQFSRAPWTFQALMNALITKGEAKLLANPSVQVLNNDSANIFIGDTIRARVAQANGLGGQTVAIVEFPVGIILLIRPRVNADGDITMHVNPVVSTVTSIGADNIPLTSSREAETTVMVKDGETMVIGGLIRDEYSKVVQEVPILSRLPIVGELFKNRTTTRRHSDVVVTITPRIVKETPKEK